MHPRTQQVYFKKKNASAHPVGKKEKKKCLRAPIRYFMYVCMYTYVYMHVCVCVCVCVCACVCVYTYMYINISMQEAFNA
jgi:hypothetical protein